MKAVILAAGYGTRFQRDVENDSSGKFKHLMGIPKPLLPVGNGALISHWVNAFNRSGCVDDIFVVTNKLYHEMFEEWARPFPNVRVLSDGTQSNEDRLGAVACLQLVVTHFKIEDHIIVVGGDTLFMEDFSLSRFTEFFHQMAKCDDTNVVLSYQCKDEETSKYGILEVNEDLRVCSMKEKPQPSETNSRRACPCFYLFSKKSIPLLGTFLEEKKGRPIEDRDAPGNFVSWLIPRKPVYVHEVSGRFDVGNLSSYIECDTFFKENVSGLKSYLQ
ncbi:hypothetical protein GJAV_G00259600 [Gymnothorax javanicus]|nr:hypothetical protein GJAV_G00259600 [Gymnothorax javanicus]